MILLDYYCFRRRRCRYHHRVSRINNNNIIITMPNSDTTIEYKVPPSDVVVDSLVFMTFPCNRYRGTDNFMAAASTCQMPLQMS